jgi:hypothetical protein
MKVRVNALEQINAHAAGVDIGAGEIYVADPPEQDRESVRSFPTFTVYVKSTASSDKDRPLAATSPFLNKP